VGGRAGGGCWKGNSVLISGAQRYADSRNKLRGGCFCYSLCIINVYDADHSHASRKYFY